MNAAGAHAPPLRTKSITVDGERTTMVPAGNATSSIGSSCSHTSFFSSAIPAEATDTSVRFQEEIHTCRSSLLRISSTNRYCVRFSERVIRTSVSGATSPMRLPASRRAASKEPRTWSSSDDPSEVTLLQVTDTGSPLPANTAVFRASSRAAPFPSSAAVPPAGMKNRSAERTACHPFTAAIIAHRGPPLLLSVAQSGGSAGGLAAGPTSIAAQPGLTRSLSGDLRRGYRPNNRDQHRTKDLVRLGRALGEQFNRIANRDHFEQLLDVAVVHPNASVGHVVADRGGAVRGVDAGAAHAETQPAGAEGVRLSRANDLPLVVPRGIGNSLNDGVGAGWAGSARLAHRRREDPHDLARFQDHQLAVRNADHDPPRGSGLPVLGERFGGSHQYDAGDGRHPLELIFNLEHLPLPPYAKGRCKTLAKP